MPLALGPEKYFDRRKFFLFLGFSLLVHLLALIGASPLDLSFKQLTSKRQENLRPLKIHTLGEKRKNPSENKIFIEPKKTSPQIGSSKSSAARRDLNFSDLKLTDSIATADHSPKTTQPTSQRPGTRPETSRIVQNQGIRFSNQELKKMAQESYAGPSQILGTDKISLHYEVPEGKNLDELNEAELRLYSFLRRGAKNYATSVAAELHEFQLKYPHLHFPLVEEKQVMTGRMTYDRNGNLKQIKMVRWSKNDKLQEFFENVLKRMEVLQNPPRELWVENDEFTIFMTLQING
jgi:hypothetical protein